MLQTLIGHVICTSICPVGVTLYTNIHFLIMIIIAASSNFFAYFLIFALPHSQALPSLPSLLVQKSRRGPGIFSHVSDVRIERMCAWVHRSQNRKKRERSRDLTTRI